MSPAAGLILKHASASRPSGQRSQDDYDVLADGIVVGRIMRAIAAPVGSPWFGHWPTVTIATADRPTAMPLPARTRWRRSRKAGDGSSSCQGTRRVHDTGQRQNERTPVD